MACARRLVAALLFLAVSTATDVNSFADLESAVDGSTSDINLVASMVFENTLYIDQSTLTIESTAGMTIMVDSSSAGSFDLLSFSSAVERLTLKSLEFIALEGSSAGLIYLTQDATLELVSCRFTQTRGYAVLINSYASGMTLRIIDTVFEDASNSYSDQPASLIQSAGGTVEVRGSTFVNNTAPLFYFEDASVSLHASRFDSNSRDASNGYAVLYAGRGNVNVSACGFINHAYRVLYLYSVDNATLTNSSFENTRALGIDNGSPYGGVVYVDSSDFEVVSCAFRNNTVSSSSSTVAGGAIYVYNPPVGSIILVADSTFERNRAVSDEFSYHPAYGGAIGLTGSDSYTDYTSSCTLVIQRCAFNLNEAFSTADIYGGALGFYQSYGVAFDFALNVSDSSFSENRIRGSEYSDSSYLG